METVCRKTPQDGKHLDHGLATFLNVSPRGKQSYFSREIAKGAFVSESALHSFDGDKPNSVRPAKARLMIIHLIRPARGAKVRPAIAGRDATIPEDQSGRLPFLCFVLHRMGFFVPRELLHER